jgi:hypothetical protein
MEQNVLLSRQLQNNLNDTYKIPENTIDRVPSDDSESNNHVDTANSQLVRKSTRQKSRPGRFTDYIVYSATSNIDSSPTEPRYPLSNVLKYNKLSEKYSKFVLSIDKTVEPNSYNEASQDPKWIDAMNNELSALVVNNTWNLVPLPKHKNAIGSKWVYRIKYKSNGEIERYKARLVAKGYNKKEVIDYTETFALIAKLSTIRLLLAIVAIENWDLHQLDINNAFLHGDLKEEVYMKVPQGLTVSNKNWFVN